MWAPDDTIELCFRVIKTLLSPELIKTCQQNLGFMQVCHHMAGNLGMLRMRKIIKEQNLTTIVRNYFRVFSEQSYCSASSNLKRVLAFHRFVFSIRIIKFHQMSGFCQQECFTFIFYIWLTSEYMCEVSCRRLKL